MYERCGAPCKQYLYADCVAEFIISVRGAATNRLKISAHLERAFAKKKKLVFINIWMWVSLNLYEEGRNWNVSKQCAGTSLVKHVQFDGFVERLCCCVIWFFVSSEMSDDLLAGSIMCRRKKKKLVFFIVAEFDALAHMTLAQRDHSEKNGCFLNFGTGQRFRHRHLSSIQMTDNWSARM